MRLHPVIGRIVGDVHALGSNSVLPPFSRSRDALVKIGVLVLPVVDHGPIWHVGVTADLTERLSICNALGDLIRDGLRI